jgi:DNA modification methylase
MSQLDQNSYLWQPDVASAFKPEAEVVISQGDSLTLLSGLPSGLAKLIITSPPYNLGKEYERVTRLHHYLDHVSACPDFRFIQSRTYKRESKPARARVSIAFNQPTEGDAYDRQSSAGRGR